ncbi:chaperone-mediated protein complex assembly [Desmophyllum pertusum]|uniref:Chaperone-mediated protein complex assembly n=1 Tax=Desmophyllum pertusum TaxID=174260 RepID=A0A9X0D7Q4_9CNID|nr:chaperone-mediated protein complex assembly [Desmophyllum pertusum]
MADGLGRMNGKYNNLFVAKALASSVKTLLGPQHSLKCCTSDGEAVICSSTSKLLQFIDIQHPAGFVINDACQGQYKKYRTNCKTLVCLAGFWSSAVQDLQDQVVGVPVPVIVRLFDDALEVCEEVCQAMSIPVIEVLQSRHDLYSPAQDYHVNAVEEANSSTVESSCCHNAGSDMLEEVDVIRLDDDDDISWYFDDHIPGVDGQIRGVDGHIRGVDSHIPGLMIISQGMMDIS